MTEKHLIIFGAIIAALIGGLGFIEYSHEQADRAAMEATLKAEQANIQEIEKAAAQREQDLSRQIAALEAVRQQAQTPAQIIKILPEYLPQLPAPIHVNTVPSPADSKLSVPESAIVPAADFKPILDQLVQCREDEIKLPACQAALADQKKINAALEAQKNAAIKAAKGGGFWKRMAHNAKVVVISVGIGLIAGKVL